MKKSFEELAEGVYDPNIFKAIFLAGGPGSGKSYVAGRTVAGRGLKTVNSDNQFELLLKKANLSSPLQKMNYLRVCYILLVVYKLTCGNFQL